MVEERGQPFYLIELNFYLSSRLERRERSEDLTTSRPLGPPDSRIKDPPQTTQLVFWRATFFTSAHRAGVVLRPRLPRDVGGDEVGRLCDGPVRPREVGEAPDPLHLCRRVVVWLWCVGGMLVMCL